MSLCQCGALLDIVVQELRILPLTADRDRREHSLLVMFGALSQECLKLCVVLVGGNTEIFQEHNRQASHHHSLQQNIKIDLHVFIYVK